MTGQRKSWPWALTAAMVVGSIVLSASGPIGVYGLIDKVVFEPNESNAERVQVWGAFAYVEGGSKIANGASPARRGYMYFRLDPSLSAQQRELVRNEWLD